MAVAQHLSFTRAADALGVTAGAASLQIRALEQYLGRSLFRRSGRDVQLTAEGLALLPRVQRSLDELEQALDDTRSDRAGGRLSVSMLASFLQQWLLRRLPDFHARWPAIDLHLHTSLDAVDFVREDFHAAVRFGGDGLWPTLNADKLLDEWLVPVCTPALLQQHGPLQGPNDLLRYPLLHSSDEPWTNWIFAQSGVQATNERPAGLSFDDSASIVRAAMQGHGLALARWSLVSDEIGQGSLALASATPLPYRRSYWFVCPMRAKDLAPVRAFREWLLDEAARSARPHQILPPM